jgi:hypothetical protein
LTPFPKDNVLKESILDHDRSLLLHHILYTDHFQNHLLQRTKTNVPLSNILCWFQYISSSLPMTPPSPQCGSNPKRQFWLIDANLELTIFLPFQFSNQFLG